MADEKFEFEYRITHPNGVTHPYGIAYLLTRYMQRRGWILQRRRATDEYGQPNFTETADNPWETIS